jgi:hypothetical protein
MDKAIATQLANIEKRTGKTLAELTRVLAASGLSKHGELRDYLKREVGIGHGDANLLVHLALKSDGASAAAEKSTAEVLDEIYTGPKASLRPVHDAVMAIVNALGPYEIAPKKGYVSLRRKKQFAMVGPATKTAVEIGLNAKDLPGDPRLVVVPPGAMCNYKVRLSTASEVDATVKDWLKRAYESAG